MIISASRRTDIPCFYTEWFINRMKEGYALSQNPMNPAQISRIPFDPELADCIVFWTKDPHPMLDKLSYISAKGYNYYFQFTLTPYGREMEPNLRKKPEILHTFQQLSKMIGPERVIWRYDPIILNEFYSMEYHKTNFARICNRLEGRTRVCIISFVDLYRKMEKTVDFRTASVNEMQELALFLQQYAAQKGIIVKTCCEGLPGIPASACIDKELIESICGYEITEKKDSGQRKYCNCVKAYDIGVYHTCKNGCRYCYANSSPERAVQNFAEHDPASPLLSGKPAGTISVPAIIKNTKQLKIKGVD